MQLDDHPLFISSWGSHTPKRDSRDVDLSDQPHMLSIGYSQRKESATMSLRWVRPGSDIEEPVPAEVLFCKQEVAQSAHPELPPPEPKTAPASAEGKGLAAEFFEGKTLEAAHKLAARTDYTVDWLWALDAPGEGLPQEHFSARWKGYLTAPRAGTYKLIAVYDDGMRLWLGGKLIIDEWHHGHPRRRECEVKLSEEPQEILVEYYQEVDSAMLSLRWVPPGESQEAVIPVSAFSHGKAPRPSLVRKVPVPTSQQYPDAERRVSEIVNSSKLKGAELAQDLIDRGRREEKGTPAQYFVIRSAFVKAGSDHPFTRLEAIDAMADAGFDVDPFAVKCKVVRAAASSLGEALKREKASPHKLCVDAEELSVLSLRVAAGAAEDHWQDALHLVDDALAPLEAVYGSTEKVWRENEERSRRAAHAGNQQNAQRFSDLAEQARPVAESLKVALDPLRGLQTELVSRVRNYKTYQKALQKLQTEPDDPAAHLVVGRWRCFHAGQWDEGLKSLAKGDNERLKAAALQELAGPPTTVKEQQRLGDAWWDAAPPTSGEAKSAILRHAGQWYRQALPETSGAEEATLQTRLAEIDKLPSAGSRFSSGAVCARLALGEWIDVLKLVDPLKHRVQGEWSRVEDRLVGRAKDGKARVMLPLAVKGSYELEVQFTRTSGDDCIGIVLPVGETACTVILSGWRGSLHGIETIDGLGADRNNSTQRPGTIENDRRYTVLADVRVQGPTAEVVVKLDGRPATKWKGKTAALGTRGWDALPALDCPALHFCNPTGAFHAARIRVRRESGAVLAPVEVSPYELTPRVGGNEGTAFRDIVPADRKLLGFGVVCDHEVIRGIRPLYGTTREAQGKLYGTETGEVTSIVAKSGYAVGAISASTGSAVDGFSIIFMRIDGDRLDPGKCYASDWIGGHGGTETKIGGSGQPVVGIHGAVGGRLDSIGLILARDPENREPGQASK
jgi:hypothetical protein